MTQPLLAIQGLNVGFKVFEGEMKVLKEVNMTVNAGEKIGLIGEMGCGKTTTMKTIIRLLAEPAANITGGRIMFNGTDTLSMSRGEFQKIRRNSLSMIFEDPTAALNPVYTIGTQVRDAVYAAGNFKSKPTRAEVQARAVRALEEVALPDPERVLNNYPVQLSGGMRQRVCIAMALLSASDLLIADEPDTSLDVTIKDQVLRLLNDLVERKGTSIILVTHSLGAVRKMTDRIYVMYAGSIMETAPTNMFFTEPLHPYSRVLVASAPRLTGRGIGEGIAGRIPDYINPPAGCRFSPRCELAVDECIHHRPEMREIRPDHFVACPQVDPVVA
ncbi:MAG: ABC transporter ATP-binding protein [Desulfobacteraceae bacterium]|nr:ABC transporter ATP-binding protein [Desulfobacteraceae bacterium]